MTNDKRLIEDYLPIVAISAEASREKSVRKGHISTLHLWWARRPLVACRAAVYGALVPASRFVPNNGSDAQKKSLGRANAAKFIERLCQYPGSPTVIAEAQQHILEAHAERLTQETGKKVTVEDILAGKAPRPKVLDMFAGGGAIPLEALRLGCDAHANDLNPVAHIIQLCTLVYPQKYGRPDPTALGVAGPKNAKGEATWGGLAAEVRYWGEWVLSKVKAEIGDLYPPIPDPEFTPPKKRKGVKDDDVFAEPQDVMDFATDPQQRLKARKGFLTPVAYLWTRTVTCKNPGCKATVPLVRQTWLCKKPGRCVALRMVAPHAKKQVRFEVVEARSESGLGFDPAGFSKGGNATCPFCGTVADNDYVKEEGWAGRHGTQLMAVVGATPGKQGKTYISGDLAYSAIPSDPAIAAAIKKLQAQTGMHPPGEPIANLPDDDPSNSLGITVRPYGLRHFSDLFTPRQQLALLSFAATTKQAHAEIKTCGVTDERRNALIASLALVTSRFANFSSALCTWFYDGGRGVKHVFARQVLTMVWDFAETNPFFEKAASWPVCLDVVTTELDALKTSSVGLPAHVARGSAVSLADGDSSFDAIITDPPYYDNVPYSSISDFFYVWLRRILNDVFKEHFASTTTPKKAEIIADVCRHQGDHDKARQEYEALMEQSLKEACRVLRPDGRLAVVYAHKTTLGWAALVEALRRAGFVVTEAWPLDTENQSRMRAMDSAALASSIFLVARKREGAETGNFEDAVKPELEQIVRERVETL
ncbi:MAG: DUF1156 domain-containing protein [Limisphaerales bacterium]